MSKFTIKNEDVLREDVVIGKVVDGTIQIADEFKNFKGPAMKALKNAIPPTPTSNPPEGSTPPAPPPVEMPDHVKEELERLRTQNAELLEMQAVKMETTPPPSPVEESALEKENRELREKLAASEQRLIDDPRVAIEEHAFLEERDDLDNPYAIPENQIREDVPAIPGMDWRGTKTPACMAWLEQYYPAYAKKRFAKYNQKIKINKRRADRRKKKDAQAIKEREQFPRDKGNFYPYKIQGEDQD